MKLKGLVWFFTIVLILISIWELSYTWVVRNHESNVKEQAEKMVKRLNPGLKTGNEDFTAAVNHTKDSILSATRDKAIYPLLGTTYLQCKERELKLGLDLQGGMNVTMEVGLDGLIKSLSGFNRDANFNKALDLANNPNTFLSTVQKQQVHIKLQPARITQYSPRITNVL